jgi:hypothetical protein
MLAALIRTTLAALLIPACAWAWEDDGHEIAAVISLG